MKNWQSAISGLAGAFIALGISKTLDLGTIPEIILLLVCIGIGNTIGARLRRK